MRKFRTEPKDGASVLRAFVRLRASERVLNDSSQYLTFQVYRRDAVLGRRLDDEALVIVPSELRACYALYQAGEDCRRSLNAVPPYAASHRAGSGACSAVAFSTS